MQHRKAKQPGNKAKSRVAPKTVDEPQRGALALGPTPKGLLNVEDAARLLNRSAPSIYRWIVLGRLEAVKIGFASYVKKSSVDWWLTPRPYTRRPPAPPWVKAPQSESGENESALNEPDGLSASSSDHGLVQQRSAGGETEATALSAAETESPVAAMGGEGYPAVSRSWRSNGAPDAATNSARSWLQVALVEEQQEEFYLSPEQTNVLIYVLRVHDATPEFGERPRSELLSLKEIIEGLIGPKKRN